MLPEIVTLNIPGEPLSYFAQGNQIIIWWDISKVTSLYPTQVTHAKESYRLNVVLDERDGTFAFDEVRKSSDWKADFPGEGFKIGGEWEWNVGKLVERTWTFQFSALSRSSIGGTKPETGTSPGRLLLRG